MTDGLHTEPDLSDGLDSESVQITEPIAADRRAKGPIEYLITAVFGPLRYHKDTIQKLKSAQQEGTLIHVARGTDALRLLYMNRTLKHFGLNPIAFMVGFMDGIRYLLSRLPSRVSTSWRARYAGISPSRRATALATTVLESAPALVMLAHRGPGSKNNRAFMRALISAQYVSDEALIIAPQAVVDPSESGSTERSLTERILGEDRKNIRLKKVRHFISYGRHKTQVRLAEAINLKSFIEERPNEPDEALAEQLLAQVEEAIADQERAISGPALAHRGEIYQSVLSDPTLQQTLKQLEAEGGDPKRLQRKARKHFDEIAALYSVSNVRRFSRALQFVFNRIYAGIILDESGLEQTLEAGKRGPLIFCPSHRSHIDYLVLSYVLWQYGVTPPHIAAGANLSFFPMGYFFRRGGAFFLRRSFKDDALYRQVFEAYVRYLLHSGTSIEFFLEGTRSRTGKLLMPRFGLLRMLVEAWREGLSDKDIHFVPISIDYERIIESESYQNELQGAQKQNENLSGLLRSTQVLRSRYGRVHLQFGEPISLKSLTTRLELGDQPPSQSSDKENQQWKHEVERLAYRILERVARVSSVTPISIIATSLLAHQGRGISRSNLLKYASTVLSFLKTQNARFSKILEHPDRIEASLQEAVSILSDRGVVMIETPGKTDLEPIFRVPENQRVQLDYYKNAIINYFAPAAIAARSLLLHFQELGKPIPFSEVDTDTRFLSYLFKREFYYRVDTRFESHFRDVLEKLQRDRFLTLEETDSDLHITIEDAHKLSQLQLWSGMLDAYIEAYLMTARSLKELRKFPMAEKELVQRAMDRCRRAFLEGEISRPETANKTVVQSALSFMRLTGIVEMIDDGRTQNLKLSEEHTGIQLDEFIDKIATFHHPEEHAHSSNAVYLPMQNSEKIRSNTSTST